MVGGDPSGETGDEAGGVGGELNHEPPSLKLWRVKMDTNKNWGVLITEIHRPVERIRGWIDFDHGLRSRNEMRQTEDVA